MIRIVTFLSIKVCTKNAVSYSYTKCAFISTFGNRASNVELPHFGIYKWMVVLKAINQHITFVIARELFIYLENI